MVEKFTANDISFKEMSEEEAVRTFQEDGYFDYQKRRMRYKKTSPDSIWATAPAKMFVAFYEDIPVGVVGFAEYRGALLGAGVHTRKEYRGRGLLDILIDKAIQEKGSRTLYINIANRSIVDKYRGKGFKDMNKDELPQQVQEEIAGIQYVDQVQKWIRHTSEWRSILKISGRTDDGREIDTDPETIRDYLTYRSWAWQSDKARKEEGLSGEGFNDKEHLELITTPRGRALGYSPKGRELKNWLLTWNKEFGERLGAIYPTGDE